MLSSLDLAKNGMHQFGRMSEWARTALDASLAFASTRRGKATPTEFYEVVNQIDKITYEEFAFNYSINDFRKHLNKVTTKKLKLDWRDVVLLQPVVYDDPKINHRSEQRIGRSPDFVDIYHYLMDNFVLADVRASEMKLILDLAQRTNVYEVIECAESIENLVDRHINYLVMVFNSRQAVMKAELLQEEAIDRRTKEVFGRLFELHMQPVVPGLVEEVAHWAGDIEIARAFQELQDAIEARDKAGLDPSMPIKLPK